MQPGVIRHLAKAELHCHLDGVLDADMVRELGGADANVAALAAQLEHETPIRSLEHWQREHYPISARFLSPFSIGLARVARVHLARWSEQNVRYGELFVSHVYGEIADDGALRDWFFALAASAAAVPDAPRVKFVACISRNKLLRLAPRLLGLARAGAIAGVSLAGDELACSIRELARPLAELREAGVGIEIHAGEQAGPESVADALEHGRPRRIGHGVRAFEDAALIARLAEARVHLEFCPSSNLRLGIVREIRELPIARALQAGVSFSINTDDPGVFACSLSSELELVANTFGLELPALMKIYEDACLAAF